MTRRARTALIGGVVIAALVLMGAGFPSKKVSPKHWANGVCTTVNDWVTATKDGATALEASLTGTNPNLRDVRDALAGYLGDTAHATTRALDGLDRAGTPKTPKGTQAAKGLTESFKGIRTSLRKLQSQAEDVSIKHKAKAMKQITSLNHEVNTQFASFSKALGKLKKLDPGHKLQKAFQADQACQALSS
jgi:hypothetical protein